MKETLVLVAIIVVIIVEVITLPQLFGIFLFGPRWFKNFIGKIRGFGTCPNCGDSWLWKPSASICHKQVSVQCTVTTDGFSASGLVPIMTGIMICRECYTKKDFNFERIAEDLKSSEWNSEDIKLVVKVLELCKEHKWEPHEVPLLEVVETRENRYLLQ